MHQHPPPGGMLAVSCAHRQRATTPPHAQRQQQWCRCQRNSMKPVCSMWQQQWQLLLLLLLLLAPGCSSSSEAAALSDGPQAITPCPGKPHCVQLVVDGTIVSVPPLFRQSVTNASVNEIVLPGTRYVLRPSSWTVFSQQQPYRLTRNLTIRGQGQEWSVMDFSLIEKKVLIAAGVTVTFRNLVLANVRKLGGFGLDFFLGEAGSMIVMDDTIRVKPACPLATDVLRSAQSFQRVSRAFPPNVVQMVPQFCFNAALGGPEPTLQCFPDALYFEHFSLLAAYNDPDKGSQYPGYILYQENTTRVCVDTVTPECLKDSNGDEELCIAMLVASKGLAGQSGSRSGAGGGDGRGGSGSGIIWNPGAVAGIAVAGGVCVLLLFLACILRRQLMRVCCGRRMGKKKQQAADPEMGLRPDGSPSHSAQQNSISIYGGPGNKAISQQVTLTTLLGAGSFGRVYKGRWHSSDVAIKIITVRSPEELPRVLREAEVMMQLDHDNIVRAFHASVWNPAEQARALQGKAAREGGRDNSGPSNIQRGGVAATAANGDTAADASNTRNNNRPKAARRKSGSFLRPSAGAGGGAGGAGGASSSLVAGPSSSAAAAAPAGPPLAAAEAASGSSAPLPPSSPALASGVKNLSTPSSSQEPLAYQQQQQQHTGSTFVNTDSSQGHLIVSRSGQLLRVGTAGGTTSSSFAAAAAPVSDSAGATGAASSSRDAAGLTGWLQMGLPQQQQSQQRAVANGRLSSSSAAAAAADCTSSTLDDVGSRGQPCAWSSAEGHASSGQHNSHSMSAGGAGRQGAAGGGTELTSFEGELDVPTTSNGHAAGVEKQQQQQSTGGRLRRHLLSGWHGRSSTSSSTGGADSSSTANAAAGGDRPTTSDGHHRPRSTRSQEQQPAGSTSSPRSSTAAAATAGTAPTTSGGGGVSSGGPVAIMHAPESSGRAGGMQQRQHHNGGASTAMRGSGGSSKVSWRGSAGNNSSSGHAMGDEGDPAAKDAQAEQQVWIILELCTGGTLLDAALAGKFKWVLQDTPQPPTPTAPDRACESRKMAMAKLLSRLLDAANGMAYLHSRGVMHGDLKAGNVLLQHSIHGSYGQTAKISDFGLSAVLINGNTHRSTASLGTITHMAPELLRNGHMSPAADVYSFAILMWEVYCGKQAWQGLHYGVVVERVVISEERPPIPDDMPDEFRMLMERCWDRDPAKRPSFQQIVECLELLLDNLGSESEAGQEEEQEEAAAAAEAAAGRPHLPGRRASAPAAAFDQQQQLVPQPGQQQQYALGGGNAQQQQPQQFRLSAPAALPNAAAGAAAAAAGVGAAAAAFVPAVPHAAALGDAAGGGSVSGASAHVSPSTPMNVVAVHTAYTSQQQQQGTADSGPTQSGGLLAAAGGDGGTGPSHATGASQAHISSSSNHLRSSASGQHQPHSSSQLGGVGGGGTNGAAAGSGGAPSKLASVLDENFYLQDL